MSSVWIVKNRETGLVVSKWPSQFDALADKIRRDDEWWEVEPCEESKLTVEKASLRIGSRSASSRPRPAHD